MATVMATGASTVANMSEFEFGSVELICMCAALCMRNERLEIHGEASN